MMMMMMMNHDGSFLLLIVFHCFSLFFIVVVVVVVVVVVFVVFVVFVVVVVVVVVHFPKHQDLHHAFPNAVGALSQRGRFHGWEKVHDAAVDVLSRGLFLPQGEGNQDWTGGPVDGWMGGYRDSRAPY